MAQTMCYSDSGLGPSSASALRNVPFWPNRQRTIPLIDCGEGRGGDDGQGTVIQHATVSGRLDNCPPSGGGGGGSRRPGKGLGGGGVWEMGLAQNWAALDGKLVEKGFLRDTSLEMISGSF